MGFVLTLVRSCESIHLRPSTPPSVRPHSHLHPHLYLHLCLYVHFRRLTSSCASVRMPLQTSTSACLQSTFTSNHLRPSIHTRPLTSSCTFPYVHLRPLTSSFITGQYTAINIRPFCNYPPSLPPFTPDPTLTAVRLTLQESLSITVHLHLRPHPLVLYPSPATSPTITSCLTVPHGQLRSSPLHSPISVWSYFRFRLLASSRTFTK